LASRTGELAYSTVALTATFTVPPNRRLLSVQRLSHNPIRAAEAFTAVHNPIITNTGHRIAGIRLGDRRAHALLQALLVFRLLPNGFLNRDLRDLLAGLLGKTADQLSAGQVSYDLRRLRTAARNYQRALDQLTQEAGSPHNTKLDSILPTLPALAV
jgi:hypothetical protein